MTDVVRAGERGRTLLELAVALALSGALLGAATPSLSTLHHRARMRGAARELASLVRSLQARAIAEGRSLGLVFEKDSAGWSYRIVADGDGDGIRTADVSIGTDPVLEPATRIAARWPGVEPGFQGLSRVRRFPPSTGWLASLEDPILFGPSHIVSFSSKGEGSSGSLYLSDGRGQEAGLVIYGATGRVRLFRYDAVREEWVP